MANSHVAARAANRNARLLMMSPRLFHGYSMGPVTGPPGFGFWSGVTVFRYATTESICAGASVYFQAGMRREPFMIFWRTASSLRLTVSTSIHGATVVVA